MSEERPAVKVTIFGNEYAIRGAAKEDYIQSLARYVDEKMKEISQGANLGNPLKIGILAAINMADEIFRLRQHLERAEKELKEKPARETPDEAPDFPDYAPPPSSSIAPEAISALSAHIDAALKEE